MIIQPKIRGFICTTAHPLGCAAAVEQDIQYAHDQDSIVGPRNVLIIGASTGYGLASRIISSFAAHAKTIGVFFEKAADEKRTASPGWYNTAAFEQAAAKKNIYAKSINGDAFSDDVKQRTADLIKKDLGKIDLVIYSLASPRRVHPRTETIHWSTLKPVGKSYTSKTVDAFKQEVKDITLEAANQAEIDNTIAVMGGEDWEMWIDFLAQENVLAEGVKTVAYSYIGPELTYPIYKEGTIGIAKDHLKQSADILQKKLSPLNGLAVVSVNKAVVTQASAAIPVVPLYISILFKLMKVEKTHEGCIEQIYRLFKSCLYAETIPFDKNGLIRIDDIEMQTPLQDKIKALWPQITTDNLADLTDVEGYCTDFYKLFGFGLKGVDYAAEVNTDVDIPSLTE